MTSAEGEYGTAIAKDVMVSMRDGVRLATDVYRPARDGQAVEGRFATILGRTAYDKSNSGMWVRPVAEFFVPRGYVVVLQDIRGRHGSEGTGQYRHTANPKEGQDGYDTIEWAAAQPWSNVKVGMVGSSHGGVVQTAASLERPPHLSAMWVDVAPTSIYAHEAREGGAMALQALGALLLHALDAHEVRDDPSAKGEILEAMENMRELVRATPFRPGETPLRHVPNLEEVLFHYYQDGEYNDFWGQECCDQARHFDRAADVPAVFSGGSYYPFAAATTGHYAAMAGKNANLQRLMMGPWNHVSMRGRGQSFSGDADFGPGALMGDERYNEMRLRWFDRWLKDVRNGVEGEPPVRLFVMGGGTGNMTAEGRLDHGGRWRDEWGWPLDRALSVTHFLRKGGALSEEPPAADEPPETYSFDPAAPVPTIGAAVTGFYELVKLPEGIDESYIEPSARMRKIVIEGGAHQKEEPEVLGARAPYLPLVMRPDVLVFQTDLLTDDVEVTGPMTVTLHVSSSAPDTDFTAKLVDVYPPSDDYPGGYHLNLCDSIIRARYRSSWTQPRFMEPGQIYVVKIRLPPLSNLFKAGHRIRLDVSSSNFPRFDVNPNTGEAMGRHTRMERALNTVHMDAEHPSTIVLPTVPAQR